MTSAPEISDSVTTTLAGLPSITLTDLDALASLQTRRDRKYLVAPEHLCAVLAVADAPLQVLTIDDQRSFSYRSTYFDTPDRRSYHDAARARPKRFKVRTRTYLSTGTCWLEVKTRSARDQTVKERIEHPLAAELEMTATGRGFLERHEVVAPHVDCLVPSLTTGYERATIYCDQRVTIDQRLWCAAPGDSDVNLGGLAHLLIVETKTSAEAPGPFDRALWQLGIRPQSLSKYAIGMAAFDPSLRANKWHRVLQRHVRCSRDEGRR